MRYHVPATNNVAEPVAPLLKNLAQLWLVVATALVCEQSPLINQDLKKTPMYKLKLLQSSIVIRGHVIPAEMMTMKDMKHLNAFQSDQGYFGRTVRLLKQEGIKTKHF
jgi:hypothetical protein